MGGLDSDCNGQTFCTPPTRVLRLSPGPRLSTMSAAEYHPDLPSPTNRDSAASAIFNLYGYSSRSSSHAQGKPGTDPESNGVNPIVHDRRSSKMGYQTEDDDDGLVEQLRSPELKASKGDQSWLDVTSKTVAERSTSRVPEDHPSSSPALIPTALGQPLQIPSSTNGSMLNGTADRHHASSTSRPHSVTGPEDLSPPDRAQQPPARRHSSAMSEASVPRTPSRVIDPAPVDGEQPPPRQELSSTQLASHLAVPHDAGGQVELIAHRQPGEEADAYHVRSTCE